MFGLIHLTAFQATVYEGVWVRLRAHTRPPAAASRRGPVVGARLPGAFAVAGDGEARGVITLTYVRTTRRSRETVCST
jgi:hypothetical protein